MPRRIEKKERGIFEKEPYSDIWWIRYYDAEGREHREKVGRRGDRSVSTTLRQVAREFSVDLAVSRWPGWAG
jgi:hypothetical protein